MSAPTAPAPVATGLWEWYGHLPGWLRDVWPALVIGAVQVGVVALAGQHQTGVRTLDAAGVALLAAGPAALVLRRYRPVACLALVLAATMAYWLTDYPRGPAFLALIVAYVNAAMRGHRRAAWGSLAVGYLTRGVDRPAGPRRPLPRLAGGRRRRRLAAGAGGGDRADPQPTRADRRGRGRPGRGGPPGRQSKSGCGSPATCTTCWPTTSR